MNKYIFNILKLENYYILGKMYINYNPELICDDDYIINIFKNSLEKSNYKLASYIIDNINIYDKIKKNDFQLTFENICLKSNIDTVSWYYSKFNDLLDISDFTIIKNSCTNINREVIRWIIKLNPILYSKKTYEYIFSKAFENLDLITMKLVYEKKRNINISVINSTHTKNLNDLSGIQIFNSIIEWLKIIGNEHCYQVRQYNNYNIYMCDLIGIKKINKKNPQLISNPTHNYNFTNINNYDLECSICMESPNEILLSCSHKFCEFCIRQWIKKNYSCPTCRKNDIKFFYID